MAYIDAGDFEMFDLKCKSRINARVLLRNVTTGVASGIYIC